MDRKFTPARQVLNLAYQALQRGDQHEARSWAQIAAWMMPNTEDPWLILAAVAKPQASIAYLERALKINPKNQRAREDLNLAYQQLNQKIPPGAQNPEIPFSQADASGQLKTASLIQVSILMLELALVLALTLFIVADGAVLPGTSFPESRDVHSNPAISPDSHVASWLQAVLAKHGDPLLPIMTLITLTPTSSSTPLPTATPFPLPTATFSPTATASPTPLPTATPTFTTSPLPTDTAQPPTGQPEGEFVAPQLPADGEKLIVVSIQKQHVYAYQGGTLVFSFIASTGHRNATDMGTYHILDKLPDPYSDPWGFWMPDWMGIYYAGDLENGFHALPILRNGQRLWANDLGTPVSYGCIVLGVQEAQELYDWADVGTTVQINP